MSEQVPENGHREAKTLRVKLPSGQEFLATAELAASFLASVWGVDEGQTFGEHIRAALGGRPVTAGRRSRSGGVHGS
jgi:hypothetical protein